MLRLLLLLLLLDTDVELWVAAKTERLMTE